MISIRIAGSLALAIGLGLPAASAAQSRGIPAPASVFGFEPGADYKLATYDQAIEYFKRLDAASNYLTLVEAGRTSQGRPMYFALVCTRRTWRGSIATARLRAGWRVRRG